MASSANPLPSGEPLELCSFCDTKPEAAEKVNCLTCGVTWHRTCLVCLSESIGFRANQWGCPKCNSIESSDSSSEDGAFSEDPIMITADIPYLSPSPPPSSDNNDMVAENLAIQADNSLTEEEKARNRQEILSGKSTVEEEMVEKEDVVKNKGKGKLNGKGKEKVVEHEYFKLKAWDEAMFTCIFCLNMLDRPVTTPCGHNFCLKCFKFSIRKQANRACPLCREQIPKAMANQPRINTTLVKEIRLSKASSSNVRESAVKVDFLYNDERHTYQEKKTGLANASGGRVFVTVPVYHFGPILAENDPGRNRGVLVGDTWEDRQHCRQWGVHFPPIRGIAGQQDYGAQSVILSGGNKDDEDHGDWFLYTGSGRRDLSRNRRQNKEQSFDQEFRGGNESLRLSCLKGYPVRVIRSFKYKHSSYAPKEKGLRYDGVYRIEKCWRNEGTQGFKVCRYLFVRCDNDAAPWASEHQGDRPRRLPVLEELERASDITERKESSSWDFDAVDGRWKWFKPPPQRENAATTSSGSRKRPKTGVNLPRTEAATKRLLKLCGCFICKDVLEMPVTTPCCGQNFCKYCLEGAFAGEVLAKQRNADGCSQRNFMKCPACSNYLSQHLNNFQVNIELYDLIARYQAAISEISAAEIFENMFEALPDQTNLIAEEISENNLEENLHDQISMDAEEEDSEEADDDDDDDDDDAVSSNA